MNFPTLPCPACDGTLVPVKDGLKTMESGDTKIATKKGECDLDFVRGMFSLWLICPSPKCGEPVCCIGSYVLEEHENGPGNKIHYEPSLYPLYFHPVIPLFPFSTKLPDRIAQPLREAFALFWSNPSASGNSLRISVEALMDHRGIKKWKNNDLGKRVAINLHNRIEAFKIHSPDLGDKLLAIKWIGNAGSHISGLTRGDMFDAFQLFEFVLEEIFSKRTASLTKISKKVNQRKGPAS